MVRDAILRRIRNAVQGHSLSKVLVANLNSLVRVNFVWMHEYSPVLVVLEHSDVSAVPREKLGSDVFRTGWYWIALSSCHR